VTIAAGNFDSGMSVVDLFVEAGLGASKGEVRRLIKGGGAKINDQKVASADDVIGADAFTDGQIKLSAGKKRHALIKQG
jgi:tyrosyl-tRNA synthetase